MGGSGFPNARRIASSQHTKFPTRTAITILSENIRATATLRRATFHRGQRRKFATKAAALVQEDAAFISILPTQSKDLVKTQFASATETCSKYMKKSPARTLTKCQCASTRLCITRWAVSGWITI